VYMYKAYQNIIYITKERLTYILVISDTSHVQKTTK